MVQRLDDRQATFEADFARLVELRLGAARPPIQTQ
jgi:hypothetical protein